MNTNRLSSRVFFFKYLSKGLLGLTIIVGAFIALQHLEFSEKVRVVLEPIYNNKTLVYTIYTFSELFFGIIPPELFMIWSLESNSLSGYISAVSLLAIISYAAGILSFYFGLFLRKTVLYRYTRRRFLSKHHNYLLQYGGLLIIIAAITPIPYSAICMLVGASDYPKGKFLLYASSRLLRYALYAFIIWKSYVI